MISSNQPSSSLIPIIKTRLSLMFCCVVQEVLRSLPPACNHSRRPYGLISAAYHGKISPVLSSIGAFHWLIPPPYWCVRCRPDQLTLGPNMVSVKQSTSENVSISKCIHTQSVYLMNLHRVYILTCRVTLISDVRMVMKTYQMNVVFAQAAAQCLSHSR